MAEVVKHVFRWLSVPIDHGTIDHVRAQGAVESPGGMGSRSFDRSKRIMAHGLRKVRATGTLAMWEFYHDYSHCARPSIATT